MRDQIKVLKYDVQGLESDWQNLESCIHSLKSDPQNLRSDFEYGFQSLRSHLKCLGRSHRTYINFRRIAISQWVRPGSGRYGKDIVLCRPNEEDTYGDVRRDAMIVTLCYSRKDNEWQSFRIVYGINPEDVENLGIFYKCPWCAFHR